MYYEVVDPLAALAMAATAPHTLKLGPGSASSPSAIRSRPRSRSRRSMRSRAAASRHRAVHDPSPRLHYLAGDDAELIAATYRSQNFESYERAMRMTLSWLD